MPETTQIEQIVARVVSQVLETHLPQLRDDMSRRVMEELRPHLEGLPVASSATVETGPAAAEPASAPSAANSATNATSERESRRRRATPCRSAGRAVWPATIRFSGGKSS